MHPEAIVELTEKLLDIFKQQDNKVNYLALGEFFIDIYQDGFDECLAVLAETYYHDLDYELSAAELMQFREEQTENRESLKKDLREWAEGDGEE